MTPDDRAALIDALRCDASLYPASDADDARTLLTAADELERLSISFSDVTRERDELAELAKRIADNNWTQACAYCDYVDAGLGAFERVNKHARTCPNNPSVAYAAKLADAARRENRVVDELLTAIEKREADIGGSRPTAEIIADMGPAYEALKDALAKNPNPSGQQCAEASAVTLSVNGIRSEASGPVGLGPYGEVERVTCDACGAQVLCGAFVPAKTQAALTEEPGPELGPHDKLPCKVSCEGGPSFGKGVTLGALLGYLARRVTYNELPGVTEEQKEGFRALLAEARGTSTETFDATNSPGRPAP